MHSARFIWCHYYICTGPALREVHVDDHDKMIVMIDGRYHFSMGGKDECAGAGDVVLFRKGEKRLEWNDPKAQPEFHVVNFQWPQMPKDFPRILKDRYGRIHQLAQWLNERWWWGGACEPSYPEAVLHLMMGELQHLVFYPTDPFAEDVRRYIGSRLAESLTVEGMADFFHMSRSKFSRKFKEASCSGISPMQEVRRLRIAHARHLLEATSMSQREIAKAIGLSDEVSLTHFMSKYIGLTPGEIRKGKGKTKGDNEQFPQGLDRCR